MAHDVLDTLPFPRGSTASEGVTLASPSGDGTRISQISTGTADAVNSPLFDNGANDGSAAGNSNYRYRSDLAGKTFATRDTKNGTGKPVLLRAVQFKTAITVGAATAATGPGRALKFDSTYGRLGVVALASAGAGEPVKPLDDAYGASKVLAYGDWGYVVEEGPCTVPIAQSATATAGKDAMSAGDGTFADATDGKTVVGQWLEVPASTAGGVTQGVLDVRRGLQFGKSEIL
jgi:hypothetical protein